MACYHLLFFSAKEHKKSLNAEVKVENKSCGRLFEPILISILLYKSIHLGSKIIKKLLEITDSAGADMKHFLGSLPDPPISESFQSSPVKHSPLFVWGNFPAVLLLLPPLVPPLKEGNSSFGSSFSIFSWSSSSLSASVIIFEEFITTFGLVHGFFLEKFIDFVEKRRLLLRSFVSGLLAFVFAEAIRTYWSVYSCFAGIFITVFVACRSNEIAYFLPYRPLSGTRN